MTWNQWILAVLSIAESRGIDVRVSYPSPGWATFNWACRNGSQFGSAGAGVEMIGLTSPERFTALWVCEYRPPVETPVPAEPWERRGRFVRRVPAMATGAALKELFK